MTTDDESSRLTEAAVLARYGADEFSGALPETRLDDAFTVMEELRRRIATLALKGNPDIRVTCSAGLAAFQGREVIFGIRPEALTDPDGADRNASSLATAECHIEVVEPAGSDTFAVTHLGGTEVVARLRADANIQPGAVTPLAFNLSKSVFFDPATENRII